MKLALAVLLPLFLTVSLSAQTNPAELIRTDSNSITQIKTDWANTGRYAEANALITKAPKAVLIGDSITDRWAKKDPEFFSENNFVGRGISRQTTAQCLARMRPDVVELHPKYVVILVGVNDLALNEGYATSIEEAVGRIKSMCDIAKANGIKPIVCSLLCSTKFSWRPEVKDPLTQIQQFNALLKEYAAEKKIKYVDYYTLLAGEDGTIRPEYSKDTVHPILEGFKKMEEYLLTFIK